MIQSEQVKELVESKIGGTEVFLVDISIGHANDIRILVDSLEGVKIEECVELSRWMNAELDQDEENFSLEVSSPGLGSSFKVKQQYEKNIGRDVEVILNDGKKKKGVLTALTEEGIALEVTEKQVAGGSQKKKKDVQVSKEFAYTDIKSTKIVIKF